MKNHQINLFIILIVSALVFLFNLDTLPANIMEARNFVTAREMVNDGNWVLTTMNGVARYEKPPLPTWLTAWSGMIGGIQNLNYLRFPAAISSMFLLFYFYFLNFKITKNKQFSLMATLIASTSYLIVFMGRQGTWDIYCHTFTIISIYYLVKALSINDKGYSNWILGGTFLGLSILSKGPVSLYALLLPFLISYGITYRFTLKNKIPQLITYIVLTLVIGGFWYAYIYYFDTHVADSISDKETTAWANRNVKPFYRYASFFVQSGVWTVAALIGLLYPYVKKRVFDVKSYNLFFFWTLISVLLLSLIPEKKERYLLPVMIPMASTTAYFLYFLAKEQFSLKKGEHYIAKFVYGLVAIIAILLPVGLYFIEKDISYSSVFLSVLTIGIGFFILYYVIKKEYAKTFSGVIAFMVSIAFVGMPFIRDSFPLNENYKTMKVFKEEIKISKLPLYADFFYSPEFWFKYGGIIPQLNPCDEENNPKEFLVITLKEVDLNERYRIQEEFSIEKLKSFDLNYFGASTNHYTDRLGCTLYKFEKK